VFLLLNFIAALPLLLVLMRQPQGYHANDPCEVINTSEADEEDERGGRKK
jgi:hypothetical protein